MPGRKRMLCGTAPYNPQPLSVSWNRVEAGRAGRASKKLLGSRRQIASVRGKPGLGRMDDQRSEILAPPGRVRVDEPFVRPAQPGGVVSHRPRRSWGRRLVWLLLVAAIVGAAIWFFPRPQPQPREGGR